ncbi:MAG: hypothetical protein WB579_19425 [Bryobacteraceae bacterium]
MKLKIDENLPRECAEVLSRGGWEADTVADEGLTGTVFASAFCSAEKASADCSTRRQKQKQARMFRAMLGL